MQTSAETPSAEVQASAENRSHETRPSTGNETLSSAQSGIPPKRGFPPKSGVTLDTWNVDLDQLEALLILDREDMLIRSKAGTGTADRKLRFRPSGPLDFVGFRWWLNGEGLNIPLRVKFEDFAQNTLHNNVSVESDDIVACGQQLYSCFLSDIIRKIKINETPVSVRWVEGNGRRKIRLEDDAVKDLARIIEECELGTPGDAVLRVVDTLQTINKQPFQCALDALLPNPGHSDKSNYSYESFQLVIFAKYLVLLFISQEDKDWESAGGLLINFLDTHRERLGPTSLLVTNFQAMLKRLIKQAYAYGEKLQLSELKQKAQAWAEKLVSLETGKENVDDLLRISDDESGLFLYALGLLFPSPGQKPEYDKLQEKLKEAAKHGYALTVDLILNFFPATSYEENVLKEVKKEADTRPELAQVVASHLYILSTIDTDYYDLTDEDKVVEAACKGRYVERELLHIIGIDLANYLENRFKGWTALQLAAQHGCQDIVQSLLDKNVEVNQRQAPDGGRTALQAAAGGGHLDIVELLCGLGADIHAAAESDGGRTALQAAAGKGDVKTVNYLLGRGAYLTEEPARRDGRTALQAAAEAGNEEIVKLLLERRVNINEITAGINGRTALQAAAGKGHLEIIRLLLDNGANIHTEAQPDGGFAGGGRRRSIRNFKFLLEKGAKVDEPPANSNGRTALQAAAGGGHLDIVQLLFEKSANILTAAVSDGGQTALQAAAGGGQLKTIEFLLGKGAKVDEPAANSGGRTALQAAAGRGQLETVKFLLGKGAKADESPAKTNGRTALQAAAGGGHLDIIRLLLEKNANIHTAAASDGGQTALQATAGGGQLATVRFLLWKGAKIDEPPAERNGRTALGAAAAGGHLDIVQLLVGRGANVNKTDSMKQTALHWAVEGSHSKVVDFLRNAGVPA
ncbi:hypothetical protein RUND412_007752 [Rhizina undulata]